MTPRPRYSLRAYDLARESAACGDVEHVCEDDDCEHCADPETLAGRYLDPPDYLEPL